MLLGLWLLVILVKFHRHAVVGVASWLLIVSAAVWISGCGPGTKPTSSTQHRRMRSRQSVNLRPKKPTWKCQMRALSGPWRLRLPSAASLPGRRKTRHPWVLLKLSKTTRRSPPVWPRRRRPAQSQVGGKFAAELEDADVADKYAASLAGNEDVASELDLRGTASRQLLAARGLDAESLADQLLDELRFPIREYAHRYTNTNPDVRSDFTETLYWQPLLITDSTGKATIRFDLSDSITTFRVSVDGHTDDGRIGTSVAGVTSRIPFQLEPKLPLEVTTGDRIELAGRRNQHDQRSDRCFGRLQSGSRSATRGRERRNVERRCRRANSPVLHA